MKGKVIQFRRGKRSYKPRQFIIEAEGIKNRRDAEKFLNKKVKWKSPVGKEIEGKISTLHGNKGLLRAIFQRGLPGQALNTKVEIEA